ncbi:hypothetical protein ACPTKN_14565 [Enterococcus faecalis]
MSKQSEKPIKEVFDYKEPFQAPQMVREITKWIDVNKVDIKREDT